MGDTGEQDLELYSTVAREKPLQVVGVFVRDVNANALFKDGNTGTGVTVAAVDDPTGSKVFESSRKTPIPKSATSPTTSSSRTTILQTHTQSLNIIPPSEFPTEYLPMPSPISAEPEDYDAISNSAQSPRTRMYVPVMSPSLKRQTSLSDPEKKRLELQNRVWAARVQMPRNIPLRVFRSPEECVEAQEILDRLSVQS